MIDPDYHLGACGMHTRFWSRISVSSPCAHVAFFLSCLLSLFLEEMIRRRTPSSQCDSHAIPHCHGGMAFFYVMAFVTDQSGFKV